MVDSDVIVSSTEIIKNKLYFATLQGKYRPKSTVYSRYFHIEDEIIYESFYLDFGPYHLCHLYFFCTKLNAKLAEVSKYIKLVFYTSDNDTLRLNAAYLIGSYAIIYLKMTAKDVYKIITEGSKWKLLTFRDASAGSPVFEISLLDVFQGLEKAYESGFFNFDQFNYEEYMHYEKVMNGDLNWIIPDKMLAFSGPHAQSQIKDDYPLHAPDRYHDYFRNRNVTTIIRLNQKSYNAKQFTDFGFKHYELFFVDGTAPSNCIVDKFLKICEKSIGAIAVHCKAGLGRTGTLIACYMMKHHNFTARESISWLRICRPGSVIGFQQSFLQDMEFKLMNDGKKWRSANTRPIPKFNCGIYSRAALANAADIKNANFVRSNFNVGSDDLENVPTTKSAKSRNTKTEVDSGTSNNKKHKDDFVSLDSIINSNQSNPSETRVHKTRASTALANAKNSYTANKNNYMLSNTSSAKPVTLKVQTTYTPKRFQSTSFSNANSKSNVSSTKTSGIHPMKISIAKTQYGKSSMYSPRANLARNHVQTYPHSAGPPRIYRGKMVTHMTYPAASQSLKSSNTPKNANATACNSMIYDSNMTPKIILPTDLYVSLNKNSSKLNDNTKKAVVLRKLTSRAGTVEQLRDLKNCNISNSDSEKDSTTTTLTNISADSLENIPCKMPTRRDKSKSSEPMLHISENINNGDIEEGVDSQGSKLCKIKASRKKAPTLIVNSLKKEGMKTRNYTNPTAAKKK